MADIFERSGLGTAADFARAARTRRSAADLDPHAHDRSRAICFPTRIRWPRRAGADGTVRAMVARFSHAFDGDLRAAAAARG